MSDYISREDALKVFCMYCGVCPEEMRKPLECDDILGHVLHTLPAADVRENVKARWIDMGDHLLCSGCGATHYGADKNFCPNCGANIREEIDHD